MWGHLRACVISRHDIETALQTGKPVVVYTADGREYRVPHRDYISFSPRGNLAIIWDYDRGHGYVPLLTVTGLRLDPTADPSFPSP